MIYSIISRISQFLRQDFIFFFKQGKVNFVLLIENFDFLPFLSNKFFYFFLISKKKKGDFQVLFFFCIYKYQRLKYPTGENFPIWSEIFGFFLSSCSMIVIPGYAIYYLFSVNLDSSISEVRFFLWYFKANF